MIQAKKTEKESTERFFQRFSNAVQQSRILLECKERMFHKKDPNKRKVRHTAMKREYYRAERERRKYY